MKSDIADVKTPAAGPQGASRRAGSSASSWRVPWAHLDIAGTAYTEREDATRVKGRPDRGAAVLGVRPRASVQVKSVKVGWTA
jgi:leucyl aminopeptidase